jgi:hypothetical protein
MEWSLDILLNDSIDRPVACCSRRGRLRLLISTRTIAFIKVLTVVMFILIDFWYFDKLA